jgi:glycosyltransferase involved in cell wall biosynthesis
MNIWLVTIGEPIPHKENQLRLHRTGIIANIIATRTNHTLTWWTSDFNHFEKVHIYGKDEIVKITSSYNLVALHGRGYKKNISIDRIYDHSEIAHKFKSKALRFTPPDIIVVSFPTLGLCEVSIELGKKWNIPVIIDYRDMWPEVFLEIVPKFLRPLFKLPLLPLFLKTKEVFKNATGLIGITEEFLNLGLQKIGRARNKFDEVFPLAYLANQFNDSQFNEATLYWNNFLPRTDKLRIIFIGTLGHQFDLETIVKAIELLQKKGIDDYEVILCGSGDKEEYLISSSERLTNLYLPGYISAAQIKSLLLNADIGLCPYNINEAFLSSIPGKAIEYMSAGLPILTTLEHGELGKLCKAHEFGFFYSLYSGTSLANSIEHLISIKKELSLKQAEIKSLYLSKFEAENVYIKYIQHLEKIVKNEFKR